MSSTPTQIFAFLADLEEFYTEKIEISSPAFSVLRRAMLAIIIRLRDETAGHDANELAFRLRTSLFEWLTVPVPLGNNVSQALQALGSANLIEKRWGTEVRSAFDTACLAAQMLQAAESLLRIETRNLLIDLFLRKANFKIYSHRQARCHFQSLFGGADEYKLTDLHFLSTVREYRETETFDVLLKIGPLRCWGWGSIPDAIATAPRFRKLEQLVWSGTSDDPGFGYDPVSSALNASGADAKAQSASSVLDHRISWRPKSVRLVGTPDLLLPGVPTDRDEFTLLQLDNNSPSVESRRASLVVVDDQHGILYPPNSQILSFDPSALPGNEIQLRVLGESLTEGMSIILPIVGDAGLGDDQAKEGTCSRIWKDKLNTELTSDPSVICAALEGKGVKLLNLKNCVEYWARPPSTVIHAPQFKSHFKILIDVLDLHQRPINGTEWWQVAWNEIRRSRGAAIQAGVREHELIEEQLIGILRFSLAAIKQEASEREAFDCRIPNESGISGTLKFFKVLSTEEGFIAPSAELRILQELNTVEQWRA